SSDLNPRFVRLFRKLADCFGKGNVLFLYRFVGGLHLVPNLGLAGHQARDQREVIGKGGEKVKVRGHYSVTPCWFGWFVWSGLPSTVPILLCFSWLSTPLSCNSLSGLAIVHL